MLVAQRSRHRIRPFRLHRPKSAEEAVSLHAAGTDGAAYMGGGIELIAAMKSGAPMSDVILLRSLSGWASIAESTGAIALGAGVTHQALAASHVVRATYPDLCAVWGTVANVRVRLKGTLAGNLMAGNPSYDFPLAAIAVGAQIEFLGSDLVIRRAAAAHSSELPRHALLTKIFLPRMRGLGFAMQLQWKPIVSFALMFSIENDNVVGRLAVGCAYDTVECSSANFEDALFESNSRDASRDIAECLCAGLPAPLSDWRASSHYRSQILKVLVGREIEKIRKARLSDAGSGEP
jgi:aerobic carbon-monoxide dehydrogenase medium subunit